MIMPAFDANAFASTLACARVLLSFVVMVGVVSVVRVIVPTAPSRTGEKQVG